jgi:UDP-glucuronate 4-epimerase
MIKKIPKKNFYQTINVCSSKTIKLMNFIKIIENYTGKIIKKKFVKKQKGDVVKTYGSNNQLKKLTKIKKFTSVKTGMKKFIDWYVEYHV